MKRRSKISKKATQILRDNGLIDCYKKSTPFADTIYLKFINEDKWNEKDKIMNYTENLLRDSLDQSNVSRIRVDGTIIEIRIILPPNNVFVKYGRCYQ